jgi:lipid-binding SYLF domain-containing protein
MLEKKEDINRTRRRFFLIVAAAAGIGSLLNTEAQAASAREIDHAADVALTSLYTANTTARDLGQRATGILVFPRIIAGGLIVGGQSGDGVLLMNGRKVAYYNISAGSLGLQAGVQSFSYALFFMNVAALDYLRRSNGWTIGSGPSVVVADQGVARSLTNMTLTEDVYAFPFGQKGLMAGLSLEGAKITEIHPQP